MKTMDPEWPDLMTDEEVPKWLNPFAPEDNSSEEEAPLAIALPEDAPYELVLLAWIASKVDPNLSDRCYEDIPIIIGGNDPALYDFRSCGTDLEEAKKVIVCRFQIQTDPEFLFLFGDITGGSRGGGLAHSQPGFSRIAEVMREFFGGDRRAFVLWCLETLDGLYEYGVHHPAAEVAHAWSDFEEPGEHQLEISGAKVVVISSDEPEALRRIQENREADIAIQRLSSGHTQIGVAYARAFLLPVLARRIRKAEYDRWHSGRQVPLYDTELEQEGVLRMVPNWKRQRNLLLNGTLIHQNVCPTRLSLGEICGVIREAVAECSFGHH